jgi:ABC-type sulfate/molybdate transport systems ATPase subunit
MAALRADFALPLRSFELELALEVGRTVALVGPSGAGKTSLLRAIAGLVRPPRGRIALGDDVWLDSERRLFRKPDERRVGLVFQEYALFPHLTVRQNVAYAGKERANEYLERFRISHLAHVKPGALSGGERQRVALARALYGDPFLVVLDEPNANLDAEGEVVLQSVLRELKARGAIVVIISHRPSALDQCEKVLILSSGAQQAFGPRDTILRKIPARLPRPATAGNLALLRQDDREIGP